MNGRSISTSLKYTSLFLFLSFFFFIAIFIRHTQFFKVNLILYAMHMRSVQINFLFVSNAVEIFFSKGTRVSQLLVFFYISPYFPELLLFDISLKKTEYFFK